MLGSKQSTAEGRRTLLRTNRSSTLLRNSARGCAPILCALAISFTLLAADGQSELELGRAALEDRQYREAITHLEVLTAATANLPEAFYLLGVAYWGEDRPYPVSANKAIVALQTAIKLDRDGPLGRLALKSLATVYLRNGRMPEARRAYQQLLKYEMREELVLLYLTRIDEIDLDTGRYVPTAQNPRNARGEVIANVGPLGMHTNQYFEKGQHTWDPVKHVNYFSQAIEADPTLFQAYNNLGVALMHLGRCREAVPYFEQALQVWDTTQPASAGTYAEPHVWRLRCHLELGDLEKAVGDYEVLQTIPEYNFFGTLYTIQLAIAAGQAENAVQPLEQALAEDPDNVEVMQTLAYAYAGVRRVDDAAEMMAEALAAIPPNSPFFRHFVGPWTQQLKAWQSQ